MSCATLDQQTTRLSVSAGALPEGFCPESMQDLFNAMAARLIVTPSANFAGIVMGSIEPTGNAGPWLKDCEEWFIFDDATARYVPITKQGFTNLEYKIASGTFIVPVDIYKLRVQAWGAGGGGHATSAGNSGVGGGGGGYGLTLFDVTPGQTINFTVGLGGAAGSPGIDGGDTTFLTLVGGGGKGAVALATAGAGGTHSGATVGINGESGAGTGGSNYGGGDGGDAGGGGGAGGATDQIIAGGVVPGGGGEGGSASTVHGPGAGAGGGITIEY